MGEVAAYAPAAGRCRGEAAGLLGALGAASFGWFLGGREPPLPPACPAEGVPAWGHALAQSSSDGAEEETSPESGPSTPEGERCSPSGGESLGWAAWTAACLGVGAVCGRRLPRRPSTEVASQGEPATPRRPTTGASLPIELSAPEAKGARASRGRARLAGYAPK